MARFRLGSHMTLPEQIDQIGTRIKKTGMRAADALALINFTFDEQMERLDAPSPYAAFAGLHELIDHTVHGAKVERFRAKEQRRRFCTLELTTDNDETLGYLNMLYLKRSVPCYYLVYVEILPAFRRLGLGSRIITAFADFLKKKRALGLLDNIIPGDDPTYSIYTNLGWRPLADVIGDGGSEGFENYMVFFPEAAAAGDLKADLVRILFALKKKRPVIEMHDNEDMVKRTIAEFQNVYGSLSRLFAEDLASGTPNTLMNFMFTRLATRLIGFHRRIETLIGYTGGESLEQLSFSDTVRRLPIQPYSIWTFGKDDGGMWGNEEILHSLPRTLKDNPTLYIESLPFYQRPYLHNWMKRTGLNPPDKPTISDLIDFGFDPTRLREFHHRGTRFIFERLSTLVFDHLLRRRVLLRMIGASQGELHFNNAKVLVNEIILIIRDKGNVYAMRRQVEGIHSQEALDQLKTVPYLKALNESAGISRCIMKTIKDVEAHLKKKFHSRFRDEIEELTYFIPWDIEKNMPAVRVDISGISLDRVWVT